MSTKHCPNCGNDMLALFQTENLKRCTDCKAEIHWPLDDGQKHTIRPSRADRRAKQ